MNDDKLNEYWVYILLCENSCFYTGYTRNLEKRYAAHLNGTASKYTRSFKPVKIIQSWRMSCEKSLAMKVEHYVKQLSRAEKEKIIARPALLEMQFTMQINASFNSKFHSA